MPDTFESLWEQHGVPARTPTRDEAASAAAALPGLANKGSVAEAPLRWVAAAGGPEVQNPAFTSHEKVVDYWKNVRGLPEHVAQGIADRVGRESGFRADLVAPDKGGPSGGLYQAHQERLADLQKLPNWQDPTVQHDWAYGQVTGGDPIASAHWDEIKGAKTREEAARKWDQYFERSAGSDADPWSRHITAAGGRRVGDQWIAQEQSRKNAAVRYADIDDLLALASETDDKSRKRWFRDSQALLKESGAEGPVFDVKREGNKARIIDDNARPLLEDFKAAGITQVPVSFRGAGDMSGVDAVVASSGRQVPLYDFKPVPTVPRETSPQPSLVERARALFDRDKGTAAPQGMPGAGQAYAPRPPYAGSDSAIGRILGEMGQGAARGFGNQPIGPSPETAAAVRSIGGPLGEAAYRTVEPWAELVGRGVSGALGAAAGGAEQTARELGEDPGMAARLGRDVYGLGETALTLGGAVPWMPRVEPPVRPQNALARPTAIAPEGQNMLAAAEAAREVPMIAPRPSPITAERAALAQKALDRGAPLTAVEIDPALTRPMSGVRSIPGSGDAQRRIAIHRWFNRELAKEMGEDTPVINQQVMKDAKRRIGDRIQRIEDSAPEMPLGEVAAGPAKPSKIVGQLEKERAKLEDMEMRARNQQMSVPPAPPRLSTFLIRDGGLKDPGGDLREILGGGKGRDLLNNESGKTLDDAAHAAWEAGYFPTHGEERPSVNDLLDAIAHDHNVRPVYSSLDEEAAHAHDQAMGLNAYLDQQRPKGGPRVSAKALQFHRDKVADLRARANWEAEQEAARPEIGSEMPFSQAVAEIRSDARKNLTKQQYGIVQRNIDNIFQDSQGLPRDALNGKIYGNLMKRGGALDKMADSADRAVAPYVGRLQDALRDLLSAHLSPEHLAEYQNLRYQYKVMKTIEPLVLKEYEGNVSPALLNAQLSKQFENRAFDSMRGRAEKLDDLGKIGQAFLKEPPTSGSSERLTGIWAAHKGSMIGASLLVGGHFAGLPLLEEALGAAGLMASARGINAMMSRTGKVERLIGNALTRLPPAPGARREAVNALMSARGANTLRQLPPPPQQPPPLDMPSPPPQP